MLVAQRFQPAKHVVYGAVHVGGTRPDPADGMLGHLAHLADSCQHLSCCFHFLISPPLSHSYSYLRGAAAV